MSTTPTDPEFKRVEHAVNELAEHFESVHIFVTRHESNDVGTYSIQRGAGNWYARLGQIKAWILCQDAMESEKGRHDQAEEEDKK